MKLNRKNLRKMILKEFKQLKESMGPGHPQYAAVGEAIMQAYRYIQGTNMPMMLQFMPSVENDIYQVCEKFCLDYGCDGHEEYVFEKVMNMIQRGM
tara:strand:- start:644 stop:931 length:288 start_codon:yes stop_codon:yes gene_type:complete